MAEVEDIRASAALLGIDFSTVDLDSIRLPPGEDFGIVSDDEDLREEELEYETGFGNIIVVDNLPVVPEEKFGKLELYHRIDYKTIRARLERSESSKEFSVDTGGKKKDTKTEYEKVKDLLQISDENTESCVSFFNR